MTRRCWLERTAAETRITSELVARRVDEDGDAELVVKYLYSKFPRREFGTWR